MVQIERSEVISEGDLCLNMSMMRPNLFTFMHLSFFKSNVLLQKNDSFRYINIYLSKKLWKIVKSFLNKKNERTDY